MRHALPILFVLSLAGCHTAPPEGVYPCTVAGDCFPMWTCRADMRCWSTALPIDAGTDAPIGDTSVDAPTPDAPTIDSGPHCGPETCNGTDDDCDGLIDEGVMTVGPAVAATSAHIAPVALVPSGSGFGIVAIDTFGAAGASWQSIDAAGTAGSVIPLGSDVDAYIPVDAVAAGSSTLIAAVGFAADQEVLFGFDAAGTRTIAPTPFVLALPSGESPAGASRFSQASASRATLYAAHAPTTGGGAMRIRRFRINLAGASPIGMSALDIATDLDSAGAFAALGTATADYVVYRRTDGRVALLAGTADDSTPSFHLVGLLGDATTPEMDYAALAVRDPSAAVSATNPLVAVWQGRNGGSGPRQTLVFVEITDTTVLASSAPVTFADAFGAWGGGFVTRTLSVIALGDAPAHWIVVSQDTNVSVPTGGLVQVREIIGAGTNIRRVPVPDEVIGPQSQIGAVMSGGTIRLVEADADGGLVTRSIGCE